MTTKLQPLLATSIETTRDSLVIRTADAEYHLQWEDCSPRLAGASTEERLHAILSPAGYGIHWPLIDEDLAVGPLVEAASRRTG
jgi:hypothetical protein